VGGFVAILTSVGFFNKNLKTTVQDDSSHLLTSPKPSIPPEFSDLIVAFSWVGEGLTQTVTDVKKTETVRDYVAEKVNEEGKLRILNSSPGDNSTLYSDLIEMFGGSLSLRGEGGPTTGLVNAGGYVVSDALDALQSTEFPNSNFGRPWSSNLKFLIGTSDAELIPFPPPFPFGGGETNLDIQAAFSAMTSLVSDDVQVNVVELVTDAFAGEDDGEVSFNVFKVLPLEVILMLDTKHVLPTIWSNSFGSDELDVPYIRRLTQEQGLLSLLGYTIVFSSGDQGATTLYNGSSSFNSEQLFPTTITSMTNSQHSSFVIDVGAVIGQVTSSQSPQPSDPRLTVMNPGTFTSETTWFSSGGGFSQYVKSPVWQEKLADDYNHNVANLPRLGYDPKGRGSPDITGPGFVNLVVNGSGDSGGIAGTSLSAPYVSGLFAVAEWQRRLAGYPAGLGCISPLLYSDQGRKIMRRDIHGDNSNYAFPGFPISAKKGTWDPSIGLGLFNAQELIELIVGDAKLPICKKIKSRNHDEIIAIYKAMGGKKLGNKVVRHRRNRKADGELGLKF
jgi:hypothetical protein